MCHLSAEAPAEIFSGEGKRRIHCLPDQKNLTAATRILVRGLEPKIKIILLKNVAIGRHVEQTDAIQVYYLRGSGGKAPSRRAIFAIS